MIAIDDEADAHQLVIDGNHPEPGVLQHDDHGVSGITTFGTRNAAVVREERDFFQRGDVGLLAHAVAEDGTVSAGVEDETRFVAFAGRDLHHRTQRIREID